MASNQTLTTLKIAVKTPLYRLFDYLPPSGVAAASIACGCRVRVPFGRRSVVGVVWEHAAESDLPADRLRRIAAVLDSTPLLDAETLQLMRFASDYYLHAPGEVVTAALPQPLREGVDAADSVLVWRLTDGLDSDGIDAATARAPRQAEVVEALREAGEQGLTGDELERHTPGWRNVRRALLAKGLVASTRRPAVPARPAATDAVPGPPLSDDQRRALDGVRLSGGFSVTVLDGVTGSGKTEVYLTLISDALAAGRQCLVLVPEIGLTPQLVSRFRERLGREPVAFHSNLSDAQRLQAWRLARAGEAGVIVGTRSAVFLPLPDAGLIVVDEEHDPSLKQQEGFRYSARDLAVVRAQALGIPAVLGSATPSLESLANVEAGRYRCAALPRRAGAAEAPDVRLIDTNVHGSTDGISGPLRDAIDAHLARDGQILIYLNRRGYAPTLICSDCGHIVGCRHCDARMTLHANRQRLLCHHCGAEAAVVADCGTCGGRLKPLGEGTERIEDALLHHFPGQRVVRIDSDTMRSRTALASALDDAETGQARILVGTQMLSKGHHFPRLTLVGIVNADQGLFGNDFRATERLAQSLVQVAGRAGREQQRGEVLIQTAFPRHPLLTTLLRSGYRGFAAEAMRERREAGWPPYAAIALLRAQAVERSRAWEFLHTVRRSCADIGAGPVRVFGPVQAMMERRAGRYRCQMLFHAAERPTLRRFLRRLRPLLDETPTRSGVRWSLDIDPIDTF